MKKLIIEARINEYQGRDDNPHVPWLAAEIAEDAARCRAEGASVVHFHARSADGSPDHSYDAYADCIRKVRAGSDILVHPTLGFVTLDASAEQRLAAVTQLAQDAQTRPDFAPTDMGSVNVDYFDPVAKRFKTKSNVYRNDTATLEYFSENIRRLGLKQYLVCWNVSFTRQAEAFMNMGLVQEPAYMLFLLSDDIMLAGHPGTIQGLDAHLAFLPKDKRIEWTVCNFNGNLLRVSEKVIKEGGHISIGLGDHPYVENGAPTNAQLIKIIAEQARALGREIASVEETKEMLAM